MKDVEKTSNFEVEYLGKIEDYVYDIEVENDHNFFANDILVHNSSYVNMTDIVNQLSNKDDIFIYKSLEKIADVYIQKILKESFELLASNMNANENKIRMARENIAKGIIITAKKKYAMNIGNSKGIQYDKPKVKIVGLEPVRSSTPMICKEKLKEAIRILLEENNDSLLSFIDKFKKEFYTLSFEQIAMPRGVSDIKKYQVGNGYSKGTPIHSRASILYNSLLDKYNLHLPKIRDGNKMRFCYLKMPNSINENVIGAINELPKEFNLDKYIDYETQFTKTFLDPLNQLCKVIHWKVEEVGSLESFFE